METKTIIDKIIDALEKRAHGQFNEFARKQLLLAVEEIKEIESDAELEENGCLIVDDCQKEHIFSRFMKTQSDLSNTELEYLIKLEEDWFKWVNSKDSVFENIPINF